MWGTNELKGPPQDHDASAALAPATQPGRTCPATQEGER